MKKLQTEMQNIDYLLLKIFIYGSAEKADEKKSEEDSLSFASKMLASTNQLH